MMVCRNGGQAGQGAVDGDDGDIGGAEAFDRGPFGCDRGEDHAVHLLTEQGRDIGGLVFRAFGGGADHGVIAFAEQGLFHDMGEDAEEMHVERGQKDADHPA